MTEYRNIKEWLLAPEARAESLAPPRRVPRRREPPDLRDDGETEIDRCCKEAYRRVPQSETEIAECERVQAWGEE
ncbi:MAG: hypothetical protein OXG38_00740 [Chloroflexi bacterium]|nr:hypothetical protein [Chloroflexota bacterium]